MTNEQEDFANRVADAKHALRQAMQRMPRGIADAGATRVQAYKQIIDEAQKLLNRNPMDPSPYREAKLSIETIMHRSIEDIVIGLKGWKDGGPKN